METVATGLRGGLLLGFARIGVDPGSDPRDQDGDVIESPPQVGQTDEVSTGVAGMEVAGESADLRVIHGAGQAIGTEEINIAELDSQGTLDIDLDLDLWAQAARDDVLGDRQPSLFRGQVVAPD